MLDFNAALKAAIQPVLPCCEEPARDDLTGQKYAVWRVTGDTTYYASGKPYRRVVRHSIEMYLMPNDPGEVLTQSVLSALKSAGFRSVRRVSSVWDGVAKRRLVTITAAHAEVLTQ